MTLTTRNKLKHVRQILNGVRYTPESPTFHGVLLLLATARTVREGAQPVECNAGIVVNPVNTPPEVVWTGPTFLSRAVGKNMLGIPISGLKFADVDIASSMMRDRKATVRVGLSVSAVDNPLCTPRLSLADDTYDRILGIPVENLGATEGLTFLVGNGWNDREMQIETTLGYLNRQVGGRLML